MSVEPRIDELFVRPPEEFVEARNALAAELRAAGDAGGATRVKGLRRPTLAAWALNRLAREDAAGLRRLREAGEDLVRAQRRALSGLDPAVLRAAGERRRQVTDELVSRALRLLREAGVIPDPHADDIRGGLDAAALDPEQGEAVAGGRLSRPPPAPSGFGSLAALSAVAEEPAAVAEEPAAVDEDAGKRRARQRVEEARRRLERAEADARARREEARHAAAEAHRAGEEVRRLERELASARRREASAAEGAESAAERADVAEATLARRREELAEADVSAEP